MYKNGQITAYGKSSFLFVFAQSVSDIKMTEWLKKLKIIFYDIWNLHEI